MDKRYFKVSYTWFDDLSCEAAITYGYLINSLKTNKLIKVDKETGDVYYRIANSFLSSGLYLSPFKIKTILEELKDNGYIDILMIKKPNQRCRYIKFNNFDDDAVLDIFYDLLDETEDIVQATMISYIIMDINMNASEELDIDNMIELIGGDWGDIQINRCLHFLEKDMQFIKGVEYEPIAYDYALNHSFSWVNRYE